jgi:DnaJ-like protein/TIR domain-containing protein
MASDQSSPSARGADLRYNLELTLEEAYAGKVAEITVGNRTLKVHVPAGVEDGTRIRLAGEGEAGEPPGDLYIFLSLAPHPVFRREGADLHRRVTVPLDTAIYGRSFDVATIAGGTVSVKCPEGAQSGTTFRVRGKGMPILRSKETGDLYVEVFVETPRPRVPKAEPTIAVSYRRSDTGLIVGRIVERLATHFGEKSVFVDIDSIAIGTDFRHHIEKVLRQTDVLLALVGPQWAGNNEQGEPRILEDTDWVRIEIETALKQDIPVVPVLIGRASMPKPQSLPSSLQPFAFRQAVELDPGRDFNVHMGRLIHGNDRLLGREKRDADREGRPKGSKRPGGWFPWT